MEKPWYEQVSKIMLAGDPKCSLKKEDRIYKSAAEKSDHHDMGKLGTVKGSFKAGDQETYLVHFDGDPEEQLTFIIGDKITKF